MNSIYIFQNTEVCKLWQNISNNVNLKFIFIKYI